VPARWLVQAVTTGSATEPPRVQRLIAATDSDGDNPAAGEWRFALSPNEALLLAISSLNDDTNERAAYTLRTAVENR
jgi:hypothetical protein